MVIGVFHDINLAMQFSDKILLFSDGQVAAYGDYRTILDGDLLKSIYAASMSAGIIFCSGLSPRKLQKCFIFPLYPRSVLGAIFIL